MKILLLPLLIMGLMRLPQTVANEIDMQNLATDSPNPLSKQLENAVKTSKEGQNSIATGPIDVSNSTTIPAVSDDKGKTKNQGLITKQIGSTKDYDKLEETALMQTFPFLEQAEKKAIDDFKELLHDPKLTKDELHKERKNWAKSQSGDVQAAYRKWELEKKENKKNAIAHAEKVVEHVSPETKALYKKIKAVIMNLNMTRKQECELIRQVMEAAEQKAQDEFFEKINMNLVSYCLKQSQPQSVRSVSIDKTSSTTPIQSINPVPLSNDQDPNPNTIVAATALPQNQVQNSSLSSSESQEQKLPSFSSSNSSASSEDFDKYRKKHRKNHSHNRVWPTSIEYPKQHHHHSNYRHMLYTPVVLPAYLPPGYIHLQYMLPQPYAYMHKPHTHHSLKYLENKLKKNKGKKNKKISISSSRSSVESESKSESEERPKKKHKKSKEVVKIASSEEKEQKSEENMEKEQKSDGNLKNNGHKSKSSSNGSSASSSGVSNSDESNVYRPRKHKKQHDKPIKFFKFKPENAPEPQAGEIKIDTGAEGLQPKPKSIAELKLQDGQQEPKPRIEDGQSATVTEDLKPEQVQNTQKQVNMGENVTDATPQNVTKQEEQKKGSIG